MVAGSGAGFQRPAANSASIRSARRRAAFLLVVFSDGRCCLPPSWKFAYHVRPRRKMRTRSPTGSEPLAPAGRPSSVAMEALVKEFLNEPIAENPQVLPGPAATALQPSLAGPGVHGLLRHLGEGRCLIDREDRGEGGGPGRIREVAGHLPGR